MCNPQNKEKRPQDNLIQFCCFWYRKIVSLVKMFLNLTRGNKIEQIVLVKHYNLLRSASWKSLIIKWLIEMFHCTFLWCSLVLPLIFFSFLIFYPSNLNSDVLQPSYLLLWLSLKHIFWLNIALLIEFNANKLKFFKHVAIDVCQWKCDYGKNKNNIANEMWCGESWIEY